MRKAFSFLFLMALLTIPASMFAQYSVDKELAEQNTPEGWTAVKLPQVPTITAANTFDITKFGASEDSADNSTAIQKALDAIPSNGGVVIIPKGTWLSGPLKINHSKTIFHLAAGATLKLLPFGEYPEKNSYDYFLYGTNRTDIIIEGEDTATSVIDGQGAAWWKAYENNPKQKRVKSVIGLNSSQRCMIRNLRIVNAPMFVEKLYGCDDITVHDYVVRAPASDLGDGKSSHNTDASGMSGQRGNFYNLDISVGDDNFVTGNKTSFIHVWNSKFGTGHGCSIGSYTGGNVYNYLFENIAFENTELGLRIKSARGRGGNVHDITMRNCTMKNVGCAVRLDCFYIGRPSTPQQAEKVDSTKTTPWFHNILVQNVTAENTVKKKAYSIYIYGLPESYIRDVTFDNVQISVPTRGMFLAYCRGIKFINGCNISSNNGQRHSIDSPSYDYTYSGTFDGSVTGINSATVKPVDNVDAPWFNLSGQRISKPSGKGVYIHSGKKIMVR